MKSSSKNRKKSPHVPDQFLGYSLQIVRFLSRLQDIGPEWNVSLEYFEDIGAESEGARIAEQVKSTRSYNPVSDRSVELWKTFSNWTDSCLNGELNPNTTRFEIFVSKNKTGHIVKAFSEADTIEKAKAVLLDAQMKLWGAPPKYELKSKIPSGLGLFISNVLEKENQEVVSNIIKNFSLHHGSGDSYKDLKTKMIKTVVPEDIVEDTIIHSLGWIQKNVNALIEQGKPAVLSFTSFSTEVTSFVRKHDRRTMLASFAIDPTQEEVQQDLKVKTYVRQLNLIDSSEEVKIKAIVDYLKASTDRAQWGKKGWVHESSFDEFEKGLNNSWSNLKTKTDIILAGRAEIERGKYLYAECSSHKAKLEGLDLPEHFTPGSFHLLSDKKAIGWHPDYMSKLDGLNKKTDN